MRVFLGVAAVSVLAAFVQAPALTLDIGPQVGAKPEAVSNSVKWTVLDSEVSANPGDTVSVRIKGDIPKNWHTYSLKVYPKFGPTTTVIELVPTELARIDGPITFEPKPVVSKDPSLLTYKYDVEVFEDTVTFTIPLKVAAAAALDTPAVLKIKITSQICDANHCKNPNTVELPFTLKKKDAAPTLTPRPKPIGKPNEVKWRLPENEQRIYAKSGDVHVFNLMADITEGWHIYTCRNQGEFIPVTAFKVEPAELGVTEEISCDRDAESRYDDGYQKVIQFFENDAGFHVPVRFGALKPGENLITIKISGQACKQVCKIMNAELDVIVIAPEGAAGILPIVPSNISSTAALVPMLSNAKNETPDLFKGGLGAFLWAAALGGLISLLTPCVFPMIPITVSFFTKRKHISHAHAIGDAAIFSLGIILTYVGVGFFFALALGGNARDLATNPWVNLAIFGVFMVMAFSLLGFYELQLPTGIINKLNQSAHGGNTKVGLLLMGLVFTLTSFSCTGPFVGTVMAAAVKGNWLWPMLGMTVFAAVFALPFFFLAIFPAMLKSLPKSGSWMNSVKVVMGLVEIAAAMKFLSSADLSWHLGYLTRFVFDIVWLVLALACAAYLLGWIRFPHDSKAKKFKWMRLANVFALLFLIGAFQVTRDMRGHRRVLGMLDPYPPPRVYPPKTTDVWESGLAAARKECKPVFFDFTGVNCVNCRRMEDHMFPRKEIADLMKNFVVVRLYTDMGEPEESHTRSKLNQQTQIDKFNSDSLPFYVIAAPDGQVIEKFEDGYTPDVEAFKKFLQKGVAGKVTGCDLVASRPDGSVLQASTR